ncbi:MAG: MBL fold metallo-hydrolase [Rhodobiaceae bacterium]|nr:MBL fold metallo-hydrolase [Rhodobiaceae bacterium]
MKFLRIGLFVFGGVAVALGVGLATLMLVRDDLSSFDRQFIVSQEPTTPAITVRYMGNTNLLISDGTTTLLTDGWFSRPSTSELLFGKIAPDLDAISDAMTKGNIGEVTAVIPVHSHYDHAMDSPEVARRTGALLVGSESTANIGRGWGLPEEQIRVVGSEEPIRFGDFTVTLIKSQHFQFPDPDMAAAALEDPVITEPLVPPVNALDYKMGGAYSVHVAHPLGTFLLQGSAGYVTGALDEYRADVVILGVGGVAAQTRSYQQDYWEQIVRVLRPDRVFPVHWDSLTDPLQDEPVMPNLLWSRVLDFQAEAGVNYALENARNDGIDAALFPMWEEVVLFPQ